MSVQSFHFDWGLCAITMEERPLYFKRPNGLIVSFEAQDNALTYYRTLYPILFPSGLRADEHTEDRVKGDRLGLLAVAVSKLPGVPWGDKRFLKTYEEAVARVAVQSQHLGTVGVRQPMTLEYVKSSDPIDTDYGRSWCHTFKTNGKDIVIWWTGKPCIMIPGETREVKATVTAHESFRGDNVTKVSRVNVPKDTPAIVEAEDENGSE